MLPVSCFQPLKILKKNKNQWSLPSVAMILGYKSFAVSV